MHSYYTMYAQYFYFVGQRSFSGHFRFSGKKIQEFLFPQVGIVDFFNLNWNNAFLSSIFFLSGSKVIKGSKGQIWFFFQMAKKIKYFKLQK